MFHTLSGWAKEVGRWIEVHLTIFGIPYWITIPVISLGMALVSIAITIAALINIPPNYFVGPHRPTAPRRRHPILYWLEALVRNLFGWFLIIFGIILSFPGVPGQGLLTILLGLMLVDFPGKRNLEQRFVRWPRVRGPVDSLRRKFGREPLRLDE